MTDITASLLTNINSDGVFDTLSKTMRGQLEEEFKAGRITGTEYSKVYVTALDNTLGQSIQFLLQKDISARQAELLIAQRSLTLVQADGVLADIELTNAQTAKVIRETTMIDKQEALLDAQILLTTAEKNKAVAELALINKQVDKLTQDILLVTAQVAQANKQVEVLTAQLLNIPKEGLLLDKQVLKTTEETTFLTQRIKTEKAQIVDTVDGVAVAGVLGKQRDLYDAQTKGFTSDTKIKITKALIDTWQVRRTTDEDTVADGTNKLNDANIGAAVSSCMVDAGMTPV